MSTKAGARSAPEDSAPPASGGTGGEALLLLGLGLLIYATAPEGVRKAIRGAVRSVLPPIRPAGATAPRDLSGKYPGAIDV